MQVSLSIVSGAVRESQLALKPGLSTLSSRPGRRDSMLEQTLTAGFQWVMQMSIPQFVAAIMAASTVAFAAVMAAGKVRNTLRGRRNSG